MYGWRARIGLMVPSTVTTMDQEFNRLVPEGVSVHVTRLYHTTSSFEGLSTLIDNIERAAAELATAKVDIIVFGCTSGGLIKGREYEQEIRDKIGKASGGIPSVTVIGSVIDALETVGIKELVVATPYIPQVYKIEKQFLENMGLKVLDIDGLNIEDSETITHEYPASSYNLAKSLFKKHPRAEGIFISCTNFRSIEILNKLEKDTGVPAISSVQATLWSCLRKISCNESITGFGSLLEKYLE
jgi:maleate isomerase